MALSMCRTITDDSARELLKHGTPAFPIACYHDDLQAEPVLWHWHEELEVLLVSEGTILATAAGEKYRLTASTTRKQAMAISVIYGTNASITPTVVATPLPPLNFR